MAGLGLFLGSVAEGLQKGQQNKAMKGRRKGGPDDDLTDYGDPTAGGSPMQEAGSAVDLGGVASDAGGFAGIAGGAGELAEAAPLLALNRGGSVPSHVPSFAGGGFAAGFADALEKGQQHKLMRDYYKNRGGGQPDYTHIDAQYGTGMGNWIQRQKDAVSNWLSSTTGGVLGKSPAEMGLDPSGGAGGGTGGGTGVGTVTGQPWDEKSPTGRYQDGGAVVRSFRSGGDTLKMPEQIPAAGPFEPEPGSPEAQAVADAERQRVYDAVNRRRAMMAEPGEDRVTLPVMPPPEAGPAPPSARQELANRRAAAPMPGEDRRTPFVYPSPLMTDEEAIRHVVEKSTRGDFDGASREQTLRDASARGPVGGARGDAQSAVPLSPEPMLGEDRLTPTMLNPPPPDLSGVSRPMPGEDRASPPVMPPPPAPRPMMPPTGTPQRLWTSAGDEEKARVDAIVRARRAGLPMPGEDRRTPLELPNKITDDEISRDQTLRDASARGPVGGARADAQAEKPPVVSTPEETSSAFDRWWKLREAEGARERARQAELQKQMDKLARLTDPLQQQTKVEQASNTAEIAKVEKKIEELKASPPTPVVTPAPASTPAGGATPVVTPAGASTSAPSTAVPLPSRPAEPSGFSPRLNVTGGAGERVIGPAWPSDMARPPAGGPAPAPTRPPTAPPPAPPPQAPANTGTASTTPPAGTGGGTGAAPVAPPPPGATPAAGPAVAGGTPAPDMNPLTRTKAYDPDLEGPGNIPPGTVVAGSRGVPTAVPLTAGAAGAPGGPAGGGGTTLDRAVAAASQPGGSQGQVGGQANDQASLLSEALSGGVRHLQNTYGQNAATAVPGAPNPRKDLGQILLHGGAGAAGHANIARIDQHLNSHGMQVSKTDKAQTLRLVHGYQFYKAHGNSKMADAFAAELLQHHNIMLQHYGHGALDALRRGDLITASSHILDGYNIHVPDGMTARKGDGSTVEFVNPHGVVTSRIPFTPQNIWSAATGMADGSLFHRELLNRYNNSPQHLRELREQRQEAREERAARTAELRDKRLEQVIAKGAGGGHGGAAPGVATPPSQIFNRGGMVHGFDRGGLEPPPDLDPEPVQTAQATSLSPTFAPTLGNAPTGAAPSQASEVPQVEAPPTTYASEQEPNPYVVPEDTYHNGELIKDTVITPYAQANPDDVMPHDPRIPSERLEDDAFRPGWQERLDALGLRAKTSKADAASYAASKDHYNKRMNEFNTRMNEYKIRKKDYETETKAERAAAKAERASAAKDAHGGKLTTEQVNQYAAETDAMLKDFKPSDAEKGKTPFDQTIEIDGKVKPVVDPVTNRRLVSEFAMRNNMPTDAAMSTYLKMTQYDPDRPNWRAYDNKGRDAVGNYIIVPLQPRRDDKGKIITDAKGNMRWDRTNDEIHIKPSEHKLLNDVVAARVKARKAELAKPPEKSVWQGVKEMTGSIFGGNPPPANTPRTAVPLQ